MKFDPLDPPRRYEAGFGPTVTISDCGRLHLAADEQVTFLTDGGAEYDVARKDWGFYATPSLNGRLSGFGLRAALGRNRVGRFFVLLVERGREDAFQAYLDGERMVLVSWLDDDASLGRLEAALAAAPAGAGEPSP